MNHHDRNNFDGVRLAAALAVLFSHQWRIAGGVEPHVLGPMTLGSLAVLVFFSISGYLVSASWSADPTVWRFAARRILRIWPAYIVAVVGAATWILMTDDRPLASMAAWMFMFKHLSLQPFEWAFFPLQHDPRLDPPLWTIPSELECYVVFALVAALLRKWWPMLLAIAFVATQVAWSWGLAAFDPSDASPETDALTFGAFFAAGALLHGLPILREIRATVVLVVAGVAAFLARSPMVGLMLTVPVLSVAVGTRAWPGLVDAGRFGDLSYGIYLWGWPIQQIVVSRLSSRLGFWPLALLALVLVGFVAAMSWHLVEKRALRVKPSSRTPWPPSLKLTLA